MSDTGRSSGHHPASSAALRDEVLSWADSLESMGAERNGAELKDAGLSRADADELAALLRHLERVAALVAERDHYRAALELLHSPTRRQDLDQGRGLTHYIGDVLLHVK